MSKAIIRLQDGKSMTVVLDAACAPISVANFVALAKSGFYKGLIFHRVIEGFMIQGGGMDVNMRQKNASSIKGEFLSNGVKNTRKHLPGTISMARTNVPNSASSQFFICSGEAAYLDGSYAAFGAVEDEASMAVVMEISGCKTHSVGYNDDVPVTPIIIDNIDIID